MAAAPAIAFGLESPASWHWTEKSIEVAGWACATGEAEYRDVRGLLDDRVILGVYGLDRPDVEKHLGGGRPQRQSGFHLRLSPWRGARTLRLQLLDAQNRWTDFHRQEITTGNDLPAERPPSVLSRTRIAEALVDLYQTLGYGAFSDLAREAKRLRSELTIPTTALAPGPGLRGVLEAPEFWVSPGETRIPIAGWLFSEEPGAPIRQLTASFLPGQENRLAWGRDRPDVATHFPQSPAARRSHFSGLVEIPAPASGPLCLKVFVEYGDGRKVLAFARRLYSRPQGKSLPTPPAWSPLRFGLTVLTLLRPAAAGRLHAESGRELRAAVAAARRQLRGQPADGATALPQREQDPFNRWREHNRLTPRLLAHLQQDAAAAAARPGAPTVSFIVPLYNTPRTYLQALLDALRAQLYPKWELCLADDASTEPHVREMVIQAARAEPRIRPVFRPENGHIAEASNSALAVATGEYVAFLDHDDLVTPDAALHVAEAILAHPGVGLLYTDEDKIDDHGRHFDPQFKGGWSPEMAITHNYVHHLTVMRRERVEQAGRLRSGFVGAQDLDLILRVAELLSPDQVVHIPQLCYHWRSHAQSTASRGDQKGYLFDSARRAIAEACQRRGLRATPFLPPFAETYALCLHQLRWDAALLAENPVTIVIPTGNRLDLLQRCVASLERTVDWRHARLLLVHDGSPLTGLEEYFRELSARAQLPVRLLRVPAAPIAPNSGRLTDLGTAMVDTPLVLHLRPDLEAEQPGWLEDMAGWMSVPGVDIVGAKLLRADRTLDHAGYFYDSRAGGFRSLFAGLPESELGYLFLPHAARNCSAVTAACLLTRAELYQRLGDGGGSSTFADIDYCQRAAAAGLRTVWTPQAVLIRAAEITTAETGDPVPAVRPPAGSDAYISEILADQPPHLVCDPTDHRFACRSFRPRIVLVAAGLDLSDTARRAGSLARHYRSAGECTVKVLTFTDGALRPLFAAAGIPVQVLDGRALLSARTPAEFDAAVTKIVGEFDQRETDLVVASSLECFWAVSAARALGKPSLLYVGDASAVQGSFAHLPTAWVQTRAREAVSNANRVVFASDLARVPFEELNGGDRFRTLPAGMDTEGGPAAATASIASRHLQMAREASLEDAR